MRCRDLLSLALAVLFVGCILNAKHNLPDGNACNASGDCKSGSCINSMCDGSKCSCPGNACNAAGSSSSDCAAGWVCVHSLGFTLGGVADKCQPLCSAPCPANWVCPAGSSLCAHPMAAALNVTISGVSGPIAVSQQQHFNAAVTNSSGDPVVALVTWTFGDGQGAQGSDTAHVYMTKGVFDVLVTADDQHGRTGQAETKVTVQ